MVSVDENTFKLIKNELDEIKEIITDRIKMRRLEKEGSMLLLEFTVMAPSFYITRDGDTDPKPTDSMIFYIDIPYGYPKVKPTVYYAAGKILASVNTFTSGRQCIDDWFYDEEHSAKNSTLVGTVKKTVMDIIHLTEVTNYGSMANKSLAEWQRKMTAEKKLPTCSLDTLFYTESYLKEHSGPPALPKKGTSSSAKVMPPLPKR